MHDFQTDDFPESAFPLPPGAQRAGSLRRDRGRARMAGTRIAITGLARNLGHILPRTIRRVERLAALFADYRVFVYENDSQDDTKPILRAWSAANRRVHVTTETLSDPGNDTSRCLRRVERMARYRQRCQEQVLDRCSEFDATIVIDLDIQGGFSADGVADTFGWDDWDFIGANGLIFRREGLRVNSLRQYDMWALRFDAAMTPIPTARAHSHLYRVGDPLVPVTSCFGGLGVYTMDAFRAGRYAGTDCEHVAFHRHLIEHGFRRLFLNPSQLVVYGRRHRFGDACVHRVLDTIDVLAGRRPAAWAFAREPAGRRAA